MRKTLGRSAVLATCVLVASAAAAGTFTGRGAGSPFVQTVFRIDTPAPGATVFGIVEVRGYVLDPRGVSRVTLLVDGAPLHDADINQPRDDVRTRYARFFGEDFPYDPGFTTSFLASNYSAGSHTLAIRVTYSNSDVEDLGTRTVTVDTVTAQAPIGGLDSPRDPAVYGTQDYISGVFPVVGWAIDAAGIRQRVSPAGCTGAPSATCKILADIEVMLNGMVVGQANYPLPRPDVANAHPDVAGAFQSGFQMNLDTSKYSNGPYTISVRVWNTAGLSTVIGSRDIVVQNSYATLAPFGAIDWPMSNGYLFSTACRYQIPPSGVEYDPSHFENWVSGWVIDQNSQPQYEGISDVQLYLDGALLKRTGPGGDCTFSSLFHQEINCYGFARPDIEYLYPQFANDAKHAGFFFAIDGDWLISDPSVGGLGVQRGLHYLSVKVATPDPIRPNTEIGRIPVMVTCNDLGDSPSFGDLEQPVAMQPMQSTELIKGWAIDLNGLKTLNFYVDGVLDGSLTAPDPNINMLRMDVYQEYPWLPYFASKSIGFQYSLDTTKYVDGVHQLVIESVDYGGWRNYWVQRPIVFDNPNRP